MERMIVADDLVKITKIEAFDGERLREIEEGDWAIGVVAIPPNVGDRFEIWRFKNNRYNGLRLGKFTTSPVKEIIAHELGTVIFTQNSKYFVEKLNKETYTMDFVEKIPAVAGFMNRSLEPLQAALGGVLPKETYQPHAD